MSPVAVLRASILQLCVADHQNDRPTLERWLRNKTTEHFCQWLNDPENFVVVAVIESTICGVGAVRMSGNLGLCYVQPGRQRSGIGSALLCSLEAQAKNWGLSKLQLISTSTARPFYEARGYVFSGATSAPGHGVLRDYHYTKQL
jgi:N-acetylglutamate synthase-like GNAT family acetyltransferase